MTHVNWQPQVSRPQDFGRVAVLMGGWSAEREISLRSGQAVLAALQRAGVQAEGVDLKRGELAGLTGFDRGFVALHGRGGEDGAIQGVLEALAIPYTGSGVMGCALSMDKLRSKQLWQAQGLPTPDYCWLREEADLATAVARLGLPLVIKPSREGSSIGISKVEREADMLAAWREAQALDTRVLAEAWIDGGEYTATLLHGQVLPMIRLETPHAFYDYQAKYDSDQTRYLCPCGLDEATEARIGELCRRAFEGLDARGWGRVDFMLDSAGEIALLELNAVPGMTDHSLVPMAAAAAGMDFETLVWAILETSLDVVVGDQP